MLTPPGAAPQRAGQTAYGNAALPAGTTTVVAAGSNLAGIIVRTAVMNGNNLGAFDLRDTANGIFLTCGASQIVSYQGMGLLISPGRALQLVTSAAGPGVTLTYDILT